MRLRGSFERKAPVCRIVISRSARPNNRLGGLDPPSTGFRNTSSYLTVSQGFVRQTSAFRANCIKCVNAKIIPPWDVDGSPTQLTHDFWRGDIDAIRRETNPLPKDLHLRTLSNDRFDQRSGNRDYIRTGRLGDKGPRQAFSE